MPRHSPLQRLGRPPAGGLVLVAMLAVVVAVALALLAGWQAQAAERAGQVAQQRRQAALAVAAERLRDWYRQHLAELDTPGGLPPDPSEALTGEPAVSGVMVRLDDLAIDGDVAGRAIHAWLRGDAATGTAATVVVDGRGLERQALAAARAQLHDLARRLETWYRAQVALDPLHRLDRNWYRPADDACLPQPGELPCLPDYLGIDRFTLLAGALALDPDAVRTPWGACCPLEASNGVDASSVVPYSLALRIRTPWNAQLRVQAVEPDGG